MIASLPMYPIDRVATEQLWTAIAAAARARGIACVPDSLDWPVDLISHWRRPDLFISQTCGYPLVTDLVTDVRVIGTFVYTAPGCDGARYRSFVIARSTDTRSTLAAFRGARVAYNSIGSQSGYNAMRSLVAPIAVAGRFFSKAIETGAHAASMHAVAGHHADIAAIDCVSYAHVCASDPELGAALRVVGETRSAPGLPFVTHGAASDADLSLMRAVLRDVVSDPSLSETLARLMVADFIPLDASDYGDILAMQSEAFAAGYPILS